MPWAAVQLKPGVDTQLTLAANQAGVSQSQLIRYKESLIQTYGGWQNYVNVTFPPVIRDLHAWQDIAGVKHLSAGATAGLTVINTSGTSPSGSQDITPQTQISSCPPNFSVGASTFIITVVDQNNPNVSVFNTVYFNTPVTVGGILLNGAYPIQSVLGASTYTIFGTGISSAAVASSGILPIFDTTVNSATITVTEPSHGVQAIQGLFVQFIAPSSVGGITVQGKYQPTSVLNSTQYTITATRQASATATSTMNGGRAQLLYYVTVGPPQTGFGFGAGAFGGTSSGGAIATGFGGTGTLTTTPGTPITAIDWTQDNFGETLLACPQDGPIYAWSPDSGFQNAQVVASAPFFNGGIFVSMPQQIVVAWRSVSATGVQDPLIVRWSDAGTYSNWTVSNQTTAGSFHFPTGSIIVGGMQCPVFGLLSTDIDVWTMTYVGGDIIFNFNRIGYGCGWISSHACGVLGGSPFWMGTNNFFTISEKGVVPLPCTVWDFVFQNLSAANTYKIRSAPNSAYNEIAWFFPSAASTGENDSYVKVHIEGQEFEWDYGALIRTAWIDLSIVGMPIGADTSGQIYQHETGNSITGTGLPTFRSGWFTLAEGQDLPFIDFIEPDFVWGTYAGSPNATVTITFYGTDNVNGSPIYTYGPFTVSQSVPYINCRIRNKFLSVQVQSNASSQFWRLGRIRFRMAQSGRR